MANRKYSKYFRNNRRKVKFKKDLEENSEVSLTRSGTPLNVCYTPSENSIVELCCISNNQSCLPIPTQEDGHTRAAINLNNYEVNSVSDNEMWQPHSPKLSYSNTSVSNDSEVGDNIPSKISSSDYIDNPNNKIENVLPDFNVSKTYIPIDTVNREMPSKINSDLHNCYNSDHDMESVKLKIIASTKSISISNGRRDPVVHDNAGRTLEMASEPNNDKIATASKNETKDSSSKFSVSGSNIYRYPGKLYKLKFAEKLKGRKSHYFSNKSFEPKKWLPPRSPYCLIQEDLYHSPWQLLIATIFLTKTQAKKAIPQILKFLERWDSPEALLSAKQEDIVEYLRPLGIQNVRSSQIKRFTEEFLQKDWTYPEELHGIGKYGNDSYRMFCVNEWRSVQPDDNKLNLYKNWLMANADKLGV